MTIGFIGCGNMAQPIIRSIIQKELYKKDDIFVYDVDTQKLTDFCTQNGVHPAKDESDIALTCNTVFLCIKPQGFEELLNKINVALNQNKPLVVSIAAGKELSFIESFLSSDARVGRVFPNLNASVCQSSSAYCVNGNCSEADIEQLGDIVSCFGTALFYPESLFSQFGVLGGCSPAYTFMYIDSLAKAAQKNGISREIALSTAIQAVLGSAMYMQQSGISPETLIDRVCSKGGTTIEGVNSLRGADLPQIIQNAYEASLKRDKELSGK